MEILDLDYLQPSVRKLVDVFMHKDPITVKQ